MPEAPDPIKGFLDYLDKEMTIMGILSSFCVAGAALIVDRVCSAEHTSFFGRLATDHPVEVFIGSGILILAALSFYLQRSWLAHLYGSTCASMVSVSATGWEPKRWVIEAYTYATWLRYRAGFLFLVLASLMYSHAIYREIYPAHPSHAVLLIVVVASLFLAISGQFLILLAHRYSNQPYRDFRPQSFRQAWRQRHTPPSF